MRSSSPIVAVVAAVGTVLWIGANCMASAAAFAPRQLPPWTSLQGHHHLAASTTTTEQQQERRLTDQEEEILFGDTINGQVVPLHERHRDKFGNLLADKTVPLNPLDHSQQDPVINKLRSMRDSLQSCPEVWMQLALICPNLRAVYDEHLSDTVVDETFAQFSISVQKSAAAFAQLGVTDHTKVAVFGENSAVWLMIDQGIQYAGGVTAVRGADAPIDELRYIYEHCDSAGIAVLQGPKLLQKLMQNENNGRSTSSSGKLGLSNAAHGPVRTIVLMHREKVADEQIQQWATQLQVRIVVFADLLASIAAPLLRPAASLTKASLATIVYTSGTTGHPKGVMLTQGNLLHQTGHRLAPSMPYEATEPLPGETMVSILPGT
jgi:long-subunit acyl-CoA synthetase (AMP-forming)